MRSLNPNGKSYYEHTATEAEADDRLVHFGEEHLLVSLPEGVSLLTNPVLGPCRRRRETSTWEK